MTIENDIFTGLYNVLDAGLTWVRHIERYTPYVAVTDIGNDDIPLVQFFWDGDSQQQQQRGLTTTRAPLTIEIFAANTKLNQMTQEKLFQYRTDVLNLVSANVSMPSVSGFIHFSYLNRSYDIHTFTDFYRARLRFMALYQEPYGSC